METEDDTFDDANSLRRVEAGGIPALAEKRLAELGEGKGAFTSDLSVADFALCRQLGLRPLAQVMGTSIYQVGYQPTGFRGGNWAGTGYGAAGELGELRVLSKAWNDARELAFSRLAQEAVSVGADAVVGVEVRSGVASWAEAGGAAIEYVVTGTAVARDGASGGPDGAQGRGAQAGGETGHAHHGSPAHGHNRRGAGGGPILTELSVADYAKLLIADVEPVGIVAWTSVFFISLIYFQMERQALGFGGALASGGSFRNFEYKGATQGFYGARERVMEQLGKQAKALGGSGIVGVRLAHTIRGTEGSGGPQSAGMIASFSALGTAVHDRDVRTPQAPKPTIDLST